MGNYNPIKEFGSLAFLLAGAITLALVSPKSPNTKYEPFKSEGSANFDSVRITVSAGLSTGNYVYDRPLNEKESNYVNAAEQPIFTERDFDFKNWPSMQVPR